MSTKYLIRQGKEISNIPLKYIMDDNLYPREDPGKVHNSTDDTTAQGVMDNSVNACMSKATFQIA